MLDVRDELMNHARAVAVNFGIYNTVRMLTGTYNVIFLLSTGISIAQVAVLQMVFSFMLLLFNFPLGVISDKYSRKFSVLAGVSMTAVFYLLILQSPNFLILIISEVFYAIGICLVSVAISAWILDSTGADKDDFSKYAHLSNRTAAVGSIISGVAGISLIYFSGSYRLGYIASSALMLLLILLFIFIPENRKKNHAGSNGEKTIIRNTLDTVHMIKCIKGSLWYLLLSCCFSAGIQIIYHFWQPILLPEHNFEHISNDDLLVLMFCYIGAFSAQYFINGRVSRHHVSSSYYRVSIKRFAFISSIMCLVLCLLITNNINILAIMAYSLIHGFTSAVPTGAKSIYFMELNDEQMHYTSGIIGATSFCGRIFSLLVLGLVALLPSSIYPAYLLIMPAVMFGLCGIILIYWPLFKKQTISGALV